MPSHRLRIFRGWIVVGAAFLAMFVGFGVAYSFGAFFPTLEREFAARRGDLSIAFAIAAFLYFALGPASGHAADRWGPRGVVGVGMLAIAVGLALSSAATQLWQIYFAYGLSVGIGIGLSYVPAVGAVQPWFRRRRGFASGIAVTGIGAGTLAVPPAVAVLIEALGWRATYLALAAMTVAVGGIAALLLDNRPDRHGALPDGDGGPADIPAEGPGILFRASLQTRPFRLLCWVAALASFGVFVPFVHLTPDAIDKGISPTAAAALIGLIGAGSIAGRFALGLLADRIGRRFGLAATLAAQSGLLAFWTVSDGYWSLAFFAVGYGLAYGGFVALVPSVCMDYFGARAIGAILGTIYSGVAIGSLLGPPLTGFAYDVTGSYVVPLLACSAGTALATATAMLLPDPMRWRASL